MQVNLFGFPQETPEMAAMPGMAAIPIDGAMQSDAMMADPQPDAAMGRMMDVDAMPAMDGMGNMMAMDRFSPLFLMWAVMMAAMMLPTFVPTARTFMDLLEAEIARPIGLIGLTMGYSTIWLGVAAILAVVQLGLIAVGLTGGMGQSMSPWFSAILLIVAGLYQFTNAKERCVHYCRSPMSMFLANFRPGLRGGIRLGFATGGYCAGCCWGLMAIGFAGGMMSLLWMGLATLLMTLEKLPSIGRWLTAPVGIGLVALGVWVAAHALIG
ncbi:DUF2182 domain-containing protein [Monaibacterium marinum]|nr:DUF2182 domain-containing protein [Monaibacterium marinum]